MKTIYFSCTANMCNSQMKFRNKSVEQPTNTWHFTQVSQHDDERLSQNVKLFLMILQVYITIHRVFIEQED